MSVISTPVTELFGIKHPILLAGMSSGFSHATSARDATLTLRSLAGMNVAAGPELAAAVTNAGGLGVIGGVGYTPNVMRQQVTVSTSYQLIFGCLLE
jgi:NAD(P)H-dependent flavin oxidoreductase YrpB (nitropropane dioxygenase family)